MSIRIRPRKPLSTKRWRESNRYWLAVGTLAAYSLGGARIPALGAPLPAGGAPNSTQASVLPVVRFDIPAGPLDVVIPRFEAASALTVRYLRPELKDLHSPGVTGLYTPENALAKLLENTGVEFKFKSSREVTLDLRASTTSVDVVERAPLSLPKYTEPLRDIPQTITIIPKSVIEQQGATTLRDVLRNVTGLTVAAGEGGVPAGDNLTLRGFSARNDIFVDGSRDLGPQSRDPFNLEQVEVIKGPNSAFTGRGSAGGAINMSSKAPALQPAYGFNLNFGTDGTKRMTGDLNMPLERLGLGERTAFRLNMIGHESGVAARDEVKNQRWGFAPSLAFGLGRPTRATLSYYKLKQDNIPDYGIPWVTPTHNVLAAYRDQPAPVERRNFYGLTDFHFETMGSDMATAKVEHDFSDTSGIRNQFRYGRSTRDSITAAPRFASNDNVVINRNGPSWYTRDNIYDNQTDLRLGFKTAGIQHHAVVGAALTHESQIRYARTVAGTPTTDLYSPDPTQRFTGTVTANPNRGDVTADSTSLYAIDTAKFGQHFELNGGIRWERFAVDGVTTAPAPVKRTDRMTSGRAGAIYKPAQNGSLYVSYGSSLNPSLEGLTYSTANTAIEPEKTYTVEGGSKWDLMNSRLSLTGAIFRVDKTNARTPGLNPDDPPQVLDGRQRVKGFELGIGGLVTRQLNVFGGYTFMDSKIVESNTPAEVGKYFINTPRHSMSVWATYTHRKFTVGMGPRYMGKRYGNTTNTRSVSGFWTVDGLLSYSVNRHLDLRLNLYNLNDAYNFDRLGGGHLIPNAGRSVNFSTGFRF